MSPLSDAQMRDRLANIRPYVMVRLSKGPAYQPPDARASDQVSIVWEHGRRNMDLSDAGTMVLVGPITGAGDLVGLCLFGVPEPQAREIMDADPAVRAGIFVYEVATFYGFPGARLP